MRKFTFGLPGKWQGLMRKAGLLLIPLVSFISSQTNAQTNIANYAFSSSMGNTYTPIIGGTTVHSGTYDDAVSAAITMGGTFPFGGANITSCYISTNGFITFGAAPTSSTYTPLSTVSSIAGAVSPYGQDAGGSTVAGAVPLISYLNTGTDFIVQYADHANYYNRSTEKLNFQIRLTYATGEINIIYGTCTNPSTVSTSGTAPQVGIRGNSSTWADNVNNLLVGNVPAATTCDWSNAVSGNANSSAMLYSGTTNGNVKIPAGLQYSWTPPGIAPVRTFAATSAITSSGATITWTAPTGATQYNVRYRIPGTCTWTNFSGNPVAAATASLSGLAPVTSYQVQVQASNGTTNSIWSHIPTSAAGAGLNGYTATGTFTTLNNACSGTPSAGTISGPSLACSGQPFNLVSTGTTVASGLKFSWQKSSDGGGTWVNLNNTATVTTPYAVAQTVATSYRLVDTCTNSGLSSISNVIDIAMNTALNCYCVYAASSSSSYFDAFATTGGSTNISNTASGFATGGYQNATGMIVTQDQGGTINFTTTLVGTTVGVAIWVDWNDDGIFDNTTERVYNTAAYVSTASGSFIVPASASAGNHRMRIAMDYNATSPSACGPSSGRGEAEDYTLKVTLAAPCSGTPAGVAITPAAVTVCGTGGATFSATTTSPGSGFTYLWESKPGGTNSWAPIAGATSSTYTATGVSGNTDYRCTISCSGSPSVSNTAAITVSSIPVNDDCANALTVTVQNYAASCSGTASINTTCATFSSNTSNSWFSSQDDDVWYKFQATSASGSINLSNVIFTSGVPVSIGVSFYNDSSDCSKVNSGHELSTTLVPSTITITSGSGLGSYSGLVPGNWYTIRFLTSGTTSRAAFDFCVMEPAPATYISSTTTQPVVTSVVAGTVGQQIIRVEVVVNGTINPLSVTQLVFNTNGTTNGADIDSARVYYTGTSTTFATTNKFGTTAQAPNGSFSFSGAQTLTGGTANTTNYFWLVYDVNCSATVGDVLDAECTSVDINGPQTPTVTSPAGSRAITAASYTASTTQPATTAVLQGSLNAQVLRVTVTACVNAPVTDLNFATTGTTNASADIVRARVFYTTSTTFSTASQFGPDYSNPNGAFTISGSQPLPTGTGYFWLVYDVAGTAPITDSLDASCLSAVVNGNMATPATVNPTGKRPIFAPIPNDDAPGSILLTVGAGCSGPIYSNVGATKSSNEVYPSCAGTAQAPVWFKFVAPASGAVRISNDLGTIGTFTDSKIGLFSAGNVNDYSTFSIISCDDDGGSALGSGFLSVLYATGLTAGSTYYVAVDLYSSSTSQGTFCVAVDELAASMLAATNTCASSYQTPQANSNATYTGWVPLLDATSKLVALVKNAAGGAVNLYSVAQTITTGASRMDALLVPYLNRNFFINNSGTVATADVQFFFTDAELTSLGASLASLNVSRVAGTTCVANYPGGATLLPQTASGSVNGASWVQVTTPGFSNFYLHQGNVPLPISVVYFSGTKSATVNNLSWKVTCTSTNVTFEIERSSNGRSFTSIGKLAANQARCLTPFDFADVKPANGINYYRLKIIDVDGHVTYTNVVAINNRTSGIELVGILPTLIHNEAVLYIAAAKAGRLQIVVSDMMGRQLETRSLNVLEGDNKVNLNFGSLAAGVYHITSINESVKSTIRFVKE